MAQIIDISLRRHADQVVAELLEERGLNFFLRRAGALPFAIEDRRIALAVELAARRAGSKPHPSVRAACCQQIRRRLIGELARAMVSVGL